MQTSLLIAGATGSIGYETLLLARQNGYRIRTFSRSISRIARLADEVVTGDATRHGAMDGLCKGIETVVSTIGASVSPEHPDRRSFRQIDTAANLRLIEQAIASGVRRFVYVSVHIEPDYAQTAYVRAHEEVVRALQTSGLHYTVVRPTGLFSAMASLLDLARKGLIPRIGAGKARTNPVHQTDVAEVIHQHLANGPGEVTVGGPQTFERTEIAEMAFRAIRRKPRLLPVPAGIMRAAGRLMRLWNPRMGELTEFLTAVSTCDCIAPVRGVRKLEDYFRDVASRRRR